MVTPTGALQETRAPLMQEDAQDGRPEPKKAAWGAPSISQDVPSILVSFWPPVLQTIVTARMTPG